MSSRALSVLAAVGLLSAASLALFLQSRSAPAATKAPSPRHVALAVAQAATSTALLAPAPPAPPASPFSALPALRIENQTSRAVLELRLYDATGRVDTEAAAQLDTLLCDARDPKQHQQGRIDRRTLQLLFKAAYHFGSHDVEVVSAYRKPGAAVKARTARAQPSTFACAA